MNEIQNKLTVGEKKAQDINDELREVKEENEAMQEDIELLKKQNSSTQRKNNEIMSDLKKAKDAILDLQ